ncbi:MAG: copper chaperone PCu(A)C [Pseudomonadota bacterium]
MAFTHQARAGAFAVAAFGLALSGCAEEPPAPEPVEIEGVFAGLEVTNARLVLAPVSGNPAALYFDAVFNGERGIAITGAEVSGAANTMVHATAEIGGKTTMGEVGPVALRGGVPQAFEPGGYHIMAMQLDDSIAAGDTVEVTLKISGGKTHVFEATVRAAGEER